MLCRGMWIAVSPSRPMKIAILQETNQRWIRFSVDCLLHGLPEPLFPYDDQ